MSPHLLRGLRLVRRVNAGQPAQTPGGPICCKHVPRQPCQRNLFRRNGIIIALLYAQAWLIMDAEPMLGVMVEMILCHTMELTKSGSNSILADGICMYIHRNV